jgi:hypothetical protein
MRVSLFTKHSLFITGKIFANPNFFQHIRSICYVSCQCGQQVKIYANLSPAAGQTAARHLGRHFVIGKSLLSVS